MKKFFLTVIAGATVLAAGCGNTTNLVAPLPAQAQTGVAYTQVEFLARPAIGEGLLYTNNFLNTYNAVTPRFIAAALADANSQQGQAAAPVLQEAVGVLNILTGLDPNNGPTTGEVVEGFLPDMMRIDTSLDQFRATNGGETSAYAAVFAPDGVTPVSGRKITDDVINITLGYLTGGVLTDDGVPYYNPNNGNGAIGHSPLNGEQVQFGPSTFPYLAAPQ